jgi:hypothetical protein
MTPKDTHEERLGTAVELYFASFGREPLPPSSDELLERAEMFGPAVQNLLADALHHVGWERFVARVERELQ